MAHETILIIDDRADMRLFLSLRLKAQGYRTVFAADALEAITRAREAQPDAILVDLRLSGSNGFLVLERLKVTATLAPITVIIVSAEKPSVAQARAFAKGQRPISTSRWPSAYSSRRSRRHWLPPVNWRSMIPGFCDESR